MAGKCKDHGCGCEHEHEKGTVAAEASGTIFKAQPLLFVSKKGELTEYVSPADKASSPYNGIPAPAFNSRFLFMSEMAQICQRNWDAIPETERSSGVAANRIIDNYGDACVVVNGNWAVNGRKELILSFDSFNNSGNIEKLIECCLLVMQAAANAKLAESLLLGINGIWLTVGMTDTVKTISEAYFASLKTAHEKDVAIRLQALAAHMDLLPAALKDTLSAFTWLCRYADIVAGHEFDRKQDSVMELFLAAGYTAAGYTAAADRKYNKLTPSQWAAELINDAMFQLQETSHMVSGLQLVEWFVEPYEFDTDQGREALTILERAGLVEMETVTAEPATHVVEASASTEEQKESSAPAQEAATVQG